jgi:hypothetical protein
MAWLRDHLSAVHPTLSPATKRAAYERARKPIVERLT